MTFQQTADLTKHLITLLKIDESSKEGLLSGIKSLEIDFSLEQMSAQQLIEALKYAEAVLKELSTQGGWLKEKHNLINVAIDKANAAIQKTTKTYQ